MGSRRGRLIAFEGTEGTGKSTHVRLAAEALQREGRKVLVTAEPGGTALGQELRRLVLERREPPPSPLAELFLYLADRAHHVTTVIRPALEDGAVVLTDRFSGSTIAYQGYGRGLDLEAVQRADAWARGGTTPAVTILLDCAVDQGLRRAHGDDRFHAELLAFHERVREGFLALAAADDRRWRILDATQPVADVHALVLQIIDAALSRP